MIDDLLGQIFGEAILPELSTSRRFQLVARCVFGLAGAVLGLAGAWHFMATPGLTGNVAMRGSMAAVFVFMACFCLFNVTLARAWRWPWRWLLISLGALFAARILFGS